MPLMRCVLQDLLRSPSAGLLLLLQRSHNFFLQNLQLIQSVLTVGVRGLDFPSFQATSWTRTAPVWRSVHLVPMETLRPTCARNVRPTVNPAVETAITASAAPKVAVNCISTRGAAGLNAQSKFSNDLNHRIFSLFLSLLSCSSVVEQSCFTFSGFYETAEDSCAACDPSCLTCDEDRSQCLSCADGYYLEAGMCRLNCSLRTYAADDGTCRRCPQHCDVCSDERKCFSEFSRGVGC